MAFGLWIDESEGLAWAQGTHEYRPLGGAVIAVTDQFRPADFSPRRKRPAALERCFAGFFGSLEEVNIHLRRNRRGPLGRTPVHVR